MILKILLLQTCSIFVMLHFRLYNLNWFSLEFVSQERVYEVFGFYNPKKKTRNVPCNPTYLLCSDCIIQIGEFSTQK